MSNECGLYSDGQLTISMNWRIDGGVFQAKLFFVFTRDSGRLTLWSKDIGRIDLTRLGYVPE